MAVTLNDKQRNLVVEGKNFATIASVLKDGMPHVTPVWMDYDGKHLVFTTEQKRLNARVLKRMPKVSVSVINHENPYEYVEIRGKVVEVTPDGAFEHIDKMAKKYMNADKYPMNQPGDVRLLVRIEPTKVVGLGA